MAVAVMCGCIVACQKDKTILDRNRFAALLIDMHLTDGTLSQPSMFGGEHERTNYAYYDGVFKKYGIVRADFDSCMRYYTARPKVFDAIYAVVTDSLERLLAVQDSVLARLRENDSVNLFPYPDTLLLDKEHPVWVVELDSIEPGNYRFATTVKLDTAIAGRRDKIMGCFYTPDGRDSLRTRVVRMYADTIHHRYEWSQYADSSYTRLVIRIADMEKPWRMNGVRGRIYGTTLFRPYTAPKAEERMRKSVKPASEKASMKLDGDRFHKLRRADKADRLLDERVR